jgi:guanylate kinase
VIERRQRKAIEELGHFDEYEHLIVNDDLERAYSLLRAIYLSRRDGTPAPAEAPGAREHAKRLVGR